MLRFSLLVGLLTSTNRRQNPCFGQYLPLLRSVCLQICLRGCRRSPHSRIVDCQSSIDDQQTFGGSLFPSQPLQVSLALSTLPNRTFKDTKKPLIGTVVVWKHIFDAASIGLFGVTSIAKLTATSDSSFDAYALALGERSRGFALYLYPDIQGILPTGLQKARVRGVSHRRRKMTVSQMRIYTSSVGRRHSPRRIYVSTTVSLDGTAQHKNQSVPCFLVFF